MSQLKLAKALGLARSTIQYYLFKSMRADLEGAKQWLADYKANKLVATTQIASTPGRRYV
jgi:hypothetical protein